MWGPTKYTAGGHIRASRGQGPCVSPFFTYYPANTRGFAGYGNVQLFSMWMLNFEEALGWHRKQRGCSRSSILKISFKKRPQSLWRRRNFTLQGLGTSFCFSSGQQTVAEICSK